jgi:periplasmic protein TonB
MFRGERPRRLYRESTERCGAMGGLWCARANRSRYGRIRTSELLRHVLGFRRRCASDHARASPGSGGPCDSAERPGASRNPRPNQPRRPRKRPSHAKRRPKSRFRSRSRPNLNRRKMKGRRPRHPRPRFRRRRLHPPQRERPCKNCASTLSAGKPRLPPISNVSSATRRKARSSGEQGIATVAFTIDRQGRLLTSRIVQSSGSATLDQETLAMLVRAQPMPAPPTNIPDNKLSFIVPVRFNIR